MKIVKLTVENLKRIVAIEILPDGNMVQITGKNGAGKSSVLDSIFWAFAGAGTHQSHPIRKGQKEARIRLDLGEIIVKREFQIKEGERGDKVVTSLRVESVDGARYSSPQGMLDALLGTLTFDPLAFALEDAQKQYEILKGFVPDVDFEAERMAQDADYNKRTDYNRIAKTERALAGSHEVVDDGALPEEPVEVESLKKQLADTDEIFSIHLEARKKRESLSNDVIAVAEAIRQNDSAVKATEERLAQLQQQSENLSKRQAAVREELDNHEIPPAPNIAVLTEEIAKRERVNKRIHHGALAEASEKASNELTVSMLARQKRIRESVAQADMPVKGLTLKENAVYLNDFPLDQASDADKLRVSCAIAMRQNAKLKVLRIRNGSLLDSDSLALLAEMAKEHDYQVWIERVDESGEIGFVIEDGYLKSVKDATDDDAVLDDVGSAKANPAE